LPTLLAEISGRTCLKIRTGKKVRLCDKYKIFSEVFQ
jgi:hypothetical protein